MGVDYSGHYGVGYKVRPFTEEELEEKELNDGCGYLIETFQEYLDEFLDDEKYSYFEVGDSMYSGEENDFYIEVLKPFDKGLNLFDKSMELKLHLKDLGIELESDFDIIGGLEVY